MFKEEEQNWIKKNVLWRREEVKEGNILREMYGGRWKRRRKKKRRRPSSSH